MVLGAEVYPEMSRKWSKAVPEGNSPVPYHNEFGSREHTMAGLYRMIKERFDKSDRNMERVKSHFDELAENMRETRQRLAEEARQPRLATEADVPTDKKTRKCAEDAAADEAKH